MLSSTQERDIKYKDTCLTTAKKVSSPEFQNDISDAYLIFENLKNSIAIDGYSYNDFISLTKTKIRNIIMNASSIYHPKMDKVFTSSYTINMANYSGYAHNLYSAGPFFVREDFIGGVLYIFKDNPYGDYAFHILLKKTHLYALNKSWVNHLFMDKYGLIWLISPETIDAIDWNGNIIHTTHPMFYDELDIYTTHTSILLHRFKSRKDYPIDVLTNIREAMTNYCNSITSFGRDGHKITQLGKYSIQSGEIPLTIAAFEKNIEIHGFGKKIIINLPNVSRIIAPIEDNTIHVIISHILWVIKFE